MASDDPTIEKGRLRKRLLPVLARISAVEAEQAGRVIAEAAEQHTSWAPLSTVALYASLGGEVDMAPLMRACWAAGKRVLLPRMRGAGGLDFARYDPEDPLVRARFGVREPGPGAVGVPLDEADWILVPGLAFDREGGRLGRGEGYYDRALAALRDRRTPSRLIGVAHAFQLVERVPMTPLDVRLDWVVTETRWIVAGAAAGSGRARNGESRGAR